MGVEINHRPWALRHLISLNPLYFRCFSGKTPAKINEQLRESAWSSLDHMHKHPDPGDTACCYLPKMTHARVSSSCDMYAGTSRPCWFSSMVKCLRPNRRMGGIDAACVRDAETLRSLWRPKLCAVVSWGGSWGPKRAPCVRREISRCMVLEIFPSSAVTLDPGVGYCLRSFLLLE